jgi:hypothetical protein
MISMTVKYALDEQGDLELAVTRSVNVGFQL